MRPPGKKVGTLTVKLERMATRYTRAAISVELRLDVHDGTFHAEYENAWYDARTKDDLCAKIRQAAQKTIDVEWTRYLVVDYSAEAWPLDDSARPETSGQYQPLSIDEDRAMLVRDHQADKWDSRYRTHVVTSIDLHWSVCEFSTPYALPEDKKKTVRMRREIESQLADRDDGNETYREVIGAPCEQEDDKLPSGAVAWTAEREALLRGVLAALGKLDARMVELFRGDPSQLARQLDAAAQQDPTRLLATPERVTKTKARGLTAKKASQPTEPASMGPIADYHERKSNMEALQRQIAERDVQIEALKIWVSGLEDEIDRLEDNVQPFDAGTNTGSGVTKD